MVSVHYTDEDTKTVTAEIFRRFYELAPAKPYSSDDLEYGIKIRKKLNAFTRRYIQPDHLIRRWLIFDLDHTSPFFWDDWDWHIPAPNFITRNKNDPRCHIVYGISPVCVSEAAKLKPMQFLAAIQTAYTERLRADQSFTHLITKNPLSGYFRTEHIHDRIYDLAELADYVDLEQRHWTRKRASNDEQYGVSRNVALFHRLRYWAYDNVTYHREQQTPYQAWMNEVLARAETLNTFAQPLPYGEIKATAKSVGKWVWGKYWPEPGKKTVRRGAMAPAFEKSELPLDLRAKQRLSARYANDQRKLKTEQAIIDAIGTLTAQGKRVTKAAVSRLTGVSREAVSRYYSHLFFD